jgi:phosphatidylinositol alpha-1,6-mannosyltransferase
MDKEKYLLVTLEYPPTKGGIATLYKSYADYWPENNFTVLANNSLGLKDSGNVKFRRLLSDKIRPRWLPAFFALHTEIKKSKGNIHIIVGQILPLGIAAYFLSKFLKFKYSLVLHGLDFSLATGDKRKKKITEKILKRADKIICSNSYAANSVKVFSEELSGKIAVVNPGIESSFVRDPQRVQELRAKHGLQNKMVLLSLGRLTKRKGVDMVIKSMKEISGNAENLVYVIAGAGPEINALKKIAEALVEEIKNKIIFLGQVSDDDKWAWLELCDIFIMPSRNIDGDYEGFGIVYLEANLAGKPVIAGDSGGVRDAVINNINGILVDPEKSSEIAAAVIKLTNDAQLRKELGEQGKRRAVENFNAKKQVEKLFKLLK